MDRVQQLISKAYTRSLEGNKNIFDLFVEECQGYYDTPVHTLQDLRLKQSTKLKGDIWEDYCVLYLQRVKGMKQVWRLCDVPSDILLTLGLKRQDMGIDIVAQNDKGYYAVQCKYKKRNASRKYTVVGWKELSTFYSLCARSGPWVKHVVMTTCNYVRHQGKKNEKDKSICLKSFQGITKEQWCSLSGFKGKVLDKSSSPLSSSVQSMREARLRFFEKKEGLIGNSTITG